MKQYHAVCSPRFPFVVVLVCVLLSLDTSLGSSNHKDLSCEEQDQGGRMMEVSSSNSGSSDSNSRRTATRKKTKKNPGTSTPTLQMFINLYPEVNDRSYEEQKHLYKVYLLHLSGATSKKLTKYETNAFNVWGCCKDDATDCEYCVCDGYYRQRSEYMFRNERRREPFHLLPLPLYHSYQHKLYQCLLRRCHRRVHHRHPSWSCY